MPISVDAETVALYVRRQRKLNALARAWIESPQAAQSTAPLAVAKTLVEACEDNLAMLRRAIR